MAKIIYFKSPIFKEYTQIDRTNVTLLSVIEELGIEKDSLSIQINGETPDEIDSSIILKEDDSVVIKRVLFGNDSGTKRTLATVVQIAALIAVSVLSGGTATPYTSYYIAGILTASSLVSGALMVRAAQLDARVSAQSVPEIDTATNSYSLTNVNNEARPLQPMPIVMGSHRHIPDIYAKPFVFVYDDENTYGEQAPIPTDVFSGITPDNGPLTTGSSWITIPAGYVENNAPAWGPTYDRFPQYDIKISPWFFGIKINELTPEIEAECRIIFKNLITNAWSMSMGAHNYFSKIAFQSYFGDSDVFPLPIYHSESSDPYYMRVNILWTIIRAYELNRKRTYLFPSETPTDFDYYSKISSFFSGTFTYYTNDAFHDCSYEQRFFRNENDVLGDNDVWNNIEIEKQLIKSGAIAGNYYPASVQTTWTIGDVMDKFGDLLLKLNGGTYLFPVAYMFSNEIEYQNIPYGITSVKKEGVDYSTQVFNYGIGDLEISERKIGISNAGADISSSEFSPINKSTWKIPDFPIHPLTLEGAYFYSEVSTSENKKLSNIDSPTDVISTNDDGQYNFINIEGALGQQVIFFVITGKIYSTSTSTGFASNSCLIEIQWKKKSDLSWQPLDQFGVFTVQNNNSKTINFKTSVGSPLPDFIDENDKLQVRIRKITLDSVNNNENKVCDLYVTRISAVTFFSDDVIKEKHRPLNLEGLFMTSLISDRASTDRYSAMVESKCWFFDFEEDEWVWGKTRNPAWWFLFFARGGYENPESDGSFSYPYSPTIGWQNYPGHPDNSSYIFGGGYTDDKIDMDKIKSWAQFCDENNLKIDLVLKDETSVADVLERIANVGRGSVSDHNSLLSVVYEDPEQVPTCLFGMANIKAGSFSVDYLVSDPVSKVTARYTDREDWETKEVEANVPFHNEENLNFATVFLEGVTEEQQAQRACNLLAARQFYQRRMYRWDVDIEGLLCKRGDLVYLSHDSTQYGVSGRIREFIFEDGIIKGIKSTSILNETIKYVTVRLPNGEMKVYECEKSGEDIIFLDQYSIEDAPYYISNSELNTSSRFNKSIPDDFIFIVGAKETSGKIVRVSSVESVNEFDFRISAVDEDPAMWAYEYDNVEPEDIDSFENSEIELVVENTQAVYSDDGKVKILWNGKNCDLVQIINKQNGLPVEGDGSYTFSNGEAVLDLSIGNYTLEVRPFAVGTPYRSVSKEVSVWLT